MIWTQIGSTRKAVCEDFGSKRAVETKCWSDISWKSVQKVRERYPRSVGALKNGEKWLKDEQKVLERYTTYRLLKGSTVKEGQMVKGGDNGLGSATPKVV